MRDREELEQLFAECKELHEESNKAYRGLLIIGPIAVVVCGAAGVVQAVIGHPVAAFFEFFLCLYVGVSLRRCMKRHEEALADWAEFELNHKIMLHILDVMEQSEDDGCSNENSDI